MAKGHLSELSCETLVSCVVVQEAEASELESLAGVFQPVSGKESLFTFHTAILAHACVARLLAVLPQNSLGNWVARYVDHGKADHYAHAEAYCLLACKGPPSRRIMVF